ncbi:MAG: shikimate kinase [Bacteroidales bacterium]|nr:shikimate kinase [Bacteroidales bacterium]
MNIALIGMMGSGKSTIGKLLSEKLNFKFIDTDEEIIKLANCSINKIFEEHGEETFRSMEKVVLSKVLKSDNQVIATGGGIIKSIENRNLLKEITTIYLKADDKTIYERVKNDNSRPLLNTENLQQTIQTILSERQYLYEQSQFTVDTTNKTQNEVINEIIEKIS